MKGIAGEQIRPIPLLYVEAEGLGGLFRIHKDDNHFIAKAPFKGEFAAIPAGFKERKGAAAQCRMIAADLN
ncbi:hypothetical protein D3C87_2057780 [compost metagenome]